MRHSIPGPPSPTSSTTDPIRQRLWARARPSGREPDAGHALGRRGARRAGETNDGEASFQVVLEPLHDDRVCVQVPVRPKALQARATPPNKRTHAHTDIQTHHRHATTSPRSTQRNTRSQMHTWWRRRQTVGAIYTLRLIAPRIYRSTRGWAGWACVKGVTSAPPLRPVVGCFAAVRLLSRSH